MILINVTVMALTMPGKASTNSTSKIIYLTLAPIASEASMTPLSISEKAPSTSLAKKATAATVSGTVTAFAPIVICKRIK